MLQRRVDAAAADAPNSPHVNIPTPSKCVLASICAVLLSGNLLGRTYVVSVDGDDAASGETGAPLKTISRAAELAVPGDTILVKPGIYRERVSPPRGGEEGKPITYRGEKLGKVFIRGSEIWKPKWEKHSEAVVFAVPDEKMCNDDVYLDSANPFRVALASTPYARDGKPEVERYQRGNEKLVYTCGQVIVNGRPWEQRPFLSEVETRAQTWTFDGETGRLYVNFGAIEPDKQLIEIAARRRVFAPHTLGLGHIVVEGFVIEHCGNQYPTNFWQTMKWAQAGAMGLRGGHHWVVRNNIFRHANTVALDVGQNGRNNERETVRAEGPAGSDNVIEKNYFLENGSAAIIGSGTTRLIVRDNVILRNNTLGFVGPKRYEHAGIKFHYINDGLIEHNYVADNPRCEGIWLDNQFPGTRVTRNVVLNNGARGIFLEMSDYKWDKVLVDHNISIGNDIQFYVHDASGSTVMHNLFANSPADAKYGQGAYIYQVTARTKTGYHSLFNNLFVNHKSMLDINYPAHRSGPQRMNRNVYDAAPDARSFIVNSASDKPSPWNPEEFHKLVAGDVDSTEIPKSGGKVALTLGEWRRFWSAHGLSNDQQSVAVEGMRVSYTEKGHELRITMPLDPKTVGAIGHEKVTRDFFGKPLRRDGTALPGPIQALAEGENVFRIWDGLPLLREGELP